MSQSTPRPSSAPEPSGPSRSAAEDMDPQERWRLASSDPRDAVAELVRRFTPGVYHLLARLLDSRELAADLTQEVFLRVQRHLHRYDPERSVRSWIYAMAWNLARDEIRRRRRRSGRARIISLETYRRARADGHTTVEPIDAGANRAEECLAAGERARWVRRALARLAPAQRAILVLREYEGLSHEELAELLACKIGTVKSRLSRARRELKESLLALRPGGLD